MFKSEKADTEAGFGHVGQSVRNPPTARDFFLIFYHVIDMNMIQYDR